MTVVSEVRIDELLREVLRGQGVLEAVKDIDVFLTPEGILAEVVVSDASALPGAQRAVDSAESQLAGERISLLPTVRALWQVEGVQRVEIASPPGVPQDLMGVLFKVTLKSGTWSQEVWVAVTPSALRVLRPLATTDQALAELVRAYLQHRLSIAGAGHWDPIREPRRELDEAAALYLRWRPYEALRAAVDEIFNPTVSKRRDLIKSFVKSMHDVGHKIRHFQEALTDLPGPGGAFSRGEWLPTSNVDFYSMLLEPEKRQLQSYYLDQVTKAEKDFPDLKAQFPIVFN